MTSGLDHIFKISNLPRKPGTEREYRSYIQGGSFSRIFDGHSYIKRLVRLENNSWWLCSSHPRPLIQSRSINTDIQPQLTLVNASFKSGLTLARSCLKGSLVFPQNILQSRILLFQDSLNSSFGFPYAACNRGLNFRYLAIRISDLSHKKDNICDCHQHYDGSENYVQLIGYGALLPSPPKIHWIYLIVGFLRLGFGISYLMLPLLLSNPYEPLNQMAPLSNTR